MRVYTLGRFNLVVDGAPPPSGRKAPQKPLQLLKALIALGERRSRRSNWAKSCGPTRTATLRTSRCLRT